ncbi:MAG TPA: hypothetical protein VK468_11785, partial [Pyrinomonadaceae bacterium]|nr:hypothetical protein [Pyrinomonadaceae bacterium]
ALRQAQLRLLVGAASAEDATVTVAVGRQLVHEEEEAGSAKKLLFKPDPKRPFAHPYYWAPFILIGNWR